MSTVVGPDARRVVQVFVGCAGDTTRVGSGYLVTAELVLTAAHVLTAAVEVTIAARADIWTAAATSWETLGGDVAVVHLNAPAAVVDVPRAAYGTLGFGAHVLDAVAVGYPAYRLTRTTAAGTRTKAFRDLDQAPGEVASLTGLVSGTIDFHINATYQPVGHVVPGKSPWEGMSGAALWARGHLVGVVTEDPTPDLPTALTATRLDYVLDELGADARATETRSLLGLGPHESLPDASIDARHHAVLEANRREALDRLPVGGLKGRGAELEAMIQFSHGDAQYFVWHADAWAGKTALMSAFVANPPGGLDIVSFFINSQAPDRRAGEQFLASVTRQLESLVGTPPAAAERMPGVTQGDFLRLLAEAAAKSVSDHRQLILLVDGLDEDAALRSDTDQPTVVSLLPRHPVHGLHVIVATRPYRTVLTAVGEDHPFVTIPAQRLAGSPHATDIKNEATAEVRRAAEHKGLGRKTVGTLAAAGSGLTVAELADLTDSTPIAIRTLLQTRLRRSIRPERANSLDGAGEGPPYVFSHATLPGFVAESLGDKIEDVYRRHIHDWATERRRQGWSSRCPHYLITGYPALLDATDDMPRLLEYALDTERHEWLAARGYDGQVLSEIRAAERLNLRREPANLLVALKLARQRMRIEDRNTNVPIGLLSTLAALGEPDRALSLAATITDNVRRAASLAAIAAAQVGAQHADDAANTLAQARTAAHAITDGSRQVTALTLIATTEITLGRPGRALDIAAAIPDDVKRVDALIAIATAQIDAGHTDDAAHTLAQARTATNAFADDVKRVDALTAIATAQMHADHQGEAATTLGKAVTAAQAITGTERQGAALALLAKAQITLGQQATGIATLDDALMRVLADAGSRSAYPPARVRVLVAIAETQIAAGQRDQAVATLERAVETSSDFHEDYDYWRRWDTVAGIGNAQAAAGLDAEARATIRLISYAPAQASALAGVAVVQAAAGLYDEARSTASLIDDPFSVGRSLSGIAEAQAHAGLLRDALTTFDGITSPEHRLSSLAEIAAAQATVGLRDEALRTAESSLIISREIPHRQHQDAAAAAIAEAQTDAGRYDRAVTAARTIGSAEHRSKTLALVAEAQMSGGLPDDAAATFDLALAAASSVSRPEGQADAYTVVGKAQARSNLRDGAAETLEKARIAADTINLVDRRTRALASIADAQVTAGLFDAATATATSIGYARQKAETFTAIASAQVRDNSYDEAETNLDNALRAADNLQFETWWAPTVRHITELYEAIGRSEKARAVPRIVLGRSVVPGASQRADTAESPEQSSAVLRRRVALALAAGPWYESVRAACQIEPGILEALT